MLTGNTLLNTPVLRAVCPVLRSVRPVLVEKSLGTLQPVNLQYPCLHLPGSVHLVFHPAWQCFATCLVCSHVPATAGGEGSLQPVAGVKPKRTAEEISYDALVHLLSSLRTCYMAAAKSIHTPARRREDAGAQPSVSMKAASLNLALVLVGNLQRQPWEDQVAESAAKEADAATAAATAATASCSAGNALLLRCRGRISHLMRLTEELHAVLFDTRRRFCHLLVLNYFSALGGMQALAARFSEAVALLWEVLDAQEAQQASESAVAGVTEDVTIPAAATAAAATPGVCYKFKQEAAGCVVT